MVKKQLISFVKRNKKIILVSLFLLLLFYGTFLRLYGLGSKSFWIDESMSALAASKIIEKGVPVYDSGAFYGRARIFHYLMSSFLLFGQNDFNARLISVIFGLATSILIFFIGKEYSDQAGWIAFVLSLFLEIFVVYSRDARMYQMEMFFFFLSGYFLYKSLGEKKYLLWSLFSFLIAYDTNPLALLLVPFFFYVFFRTKMDWWIYVLGAIVVLYFVSKYMGVVGEFRMFYLIKYLDYLKYYLPFLALAIVGFVLTLKNKLTWFLSITFFFILLATGFNKLFGYRYVYLAFLPLIVLVAVPLSKIHFKWIIVGAYMIWLSNIFVPFTYSFILIPEETISHFDFTAPRADFRPLYEDIYNIYSNQTLIVTFTPAAQWYFKKPDYWTYFSFSNLGGRAKGESLYGEYDAYTGANVIYNLEDFLEIGGEKIFVADTWGLRKINPEISRFVTWNCTKFIDRQTIFAFNCS